MWKTYSVDEGKWAGTFTKKEGLLNNQSYLQYLHSCESSNSIEQFDDSHKADPMYCPLSRMTGYNRASTLMLRSTCTEPWAVLINVQVVMTWLLIEITHLEQFSRVIPFTVSVNERMNGERVRASNTPVQKGPDSRNRPGGSLPPPRSRHPIVRSLELPPWASRATVRWRQRYDWASWRDLKQYENLLKISV